MSNARFQGARVPAARAEMSGAGVGYATDGMMPAGGTQQCVPPHLAPRKLIVDLQKLERSGQLPGPGAAGVWVGRTVMKSEPHNGAARKHRLDAVRKLRKLGLGFSDIRMIYRRLIEEFQVTGAVSRWPTIGQDRAVLETIADCAAVLAELLLRSSPRVELHLAVAAQRALGDIEAFRRLAIDAEAMAGHVGAVACKLTQSRKRAHPQWIRALVEVANARASIRDLIGTPSARPRGRFFLACQASFTLVGQHASPEASIVAYLKP